MEIRNEYSGRAAIAYRTAIYSEQIQQQKQQKKRKRQSVLCRSHTSWFCVEHRCVWWGKISLCLTACVYLFLSRHPSLPALVSIPHKQIFRTGEGGGGGSLARWVDVFMRRGNNERRRWWDNMLSEMFHSMYCDPHQSTEPSYRINVWLKWEIFHSLQLYVICSCCGLWNHFCRNELYLSMEFSSNSNVGFNSKVHKEPN